MNDVMVMRLDYVGPLVRVSVLAGKFRGRTPNFDRMRVVHETRWCESETEARNEALPKYFEVYEQRNGHKHPEDPACNSAQPTPHEVVVIAA